MVTPLQIENVCDILSHRFTDWDIGPIVRNQMHARLQNCSSKTIYTVAIEYFKKKFYHQPTPNQFVTEVLLRDKTDQALEEMRLYLLNPQVRDP